MDEKIINKKSLYIFVIGLVLFLLVSIYMKSITFILGYCIGYVIDLLNFQLTIKMTDAILGTGHGVIMVIVMNIAKYALFIIGLGSGILFKEYVNIFAVLFGLMTTKITIYILNHLLQKGEVK